MSWSNSNKKSYLILLSGGLLGLLPFAHPHTFIVGMLFLGYLTTVRFWYKYSDSKYWLYALLLAIAIALPQGLWQILATYHKGFSSWHFGWVKLPEENIVIFWLRSIGLELPFLFCLPFVIRANAERWKLYFFLPYLFLFLLVNVYIFQPYSYDNIKLLFFVHLGGSLFIGWLFSVWLRRGKCAYFITSLALLSLITTGTLSLIQQSTDTWIFLSNKDIAFAKQARAIIPPNSLVLVADQHNHPISTLAGRHILLGYRGWLWSYGVDYTSLEQDELTMFAGMSTSAQLLSKYGIDYAVIGPPERSIWGANQDFFATRYPLVLQSGDWTVYKISK